MSLDPNLTEVQAIKAELRKHAANTARLQNDAIASREAGYRALWFQASSPEVLEALLNDIGAVDLQTLFDADSKFADASNATMDALGALGVHMPHSRNVATVGKPFEVTFDPSTGFHVTVPAQVDTTPAPPDSTIDPTTT